MIILASKSPRRKELLSKIVSNFIIVPSNIDERKYDISSLSKIKAEQINKLYPNNLIISADTFILFNGKIFNKPKDKLDAFNTLKTLSNHTHEVVTYYTIINNNISITKKVVTNVTFNDLSDDLINRYIESGSPLDKAGSYGIQDNDKFPLVKSYKGSLYNIIGLPIEELKIDLLNLGINLD